MSKRPPSPPPEISGFQYLSVIGSGGFSDVFLYQQRRPRRRVAVKVLLNEWSSPAQHAAFDAEADLMATLSTHPSIVTMYEANVAADGRPYLAMEYCSKPSLGARYRQERFSVAEALRIGVQIAGAVETAHRAGILHRDIKPANILVTEYGHPVLTDFGISSTIDDAGLAEGMSVPWSPPESFEDPPTSSVLTDVWALGATIYTLLARRSPFEVPGGSNSSTALIARIQQQELMPTGRSDVPASLERVLATAMAKSRASRYQSVLELARGLQQVQNDLSFAVSPIDLLEDVGTDQAAPAVGTDQAAPSVGAGFAATGPTGLIGDGQPRPGDALRIGGDGPARDRVPSLGTSFPSVAPPPRPEALAPVGPAPLVPVERPPVQPIDRPTDRPSGPTGAVPPLSRSTAPWHVTSAESTASGRARTSSEPSHRHRTGPAVSGPGGKRPTWVWPTVGGVTAVLMAVLAATIWWPASDPAPPAPIASVGGGEGAAEGIPDITGLTGAWNSEFGVVDFTWDAVNGLGSGDGYGYLQTAPAAEAMMLYEGTLKTTASIYAVKGDEVCIEVVVMMKDGRSSEKPASLCVKAGA